MKNPLRWFQRNQLHVPLLTPHTCEFDTHYGCEPVHNFAGTHIGVVIYCKCGNWRVIPAF